VRHANNGGSNDRDHGVLALHTLFAVAGVTARRGTYGSLVAGSTPRAPYVDSLSTLSTPRPSTWR